MDLMPWRAIMELSKVYEAGCAKYGDRNWEKGMPISQYADSGPRHFGKWMIGRNDEEHLKMACWNFMSLLDTIIRIKDGILPESLNDLPCCPDFKEETLVPSKWGKGVKEVLNEAMTPSQVNEAIRKDHAMAINDALSAEEVEELVNLGEPTDWLQCGANKDATPKFPEDDPKESKVADAFTSHDHNFIAGETVERQIILLEQGTEAEGEESNKDWLIRQCGLYNLVALDKTTLQCDRATEHLVGGSDGS